MLTGKQINQFMYLLNTRLFRLFANNTQNRVERSVRVGVREDGHPLPN